MTSAAAPGAAPDRPPTGAPDPVRPQLTDDLAGGLAVRPAAEVMTTPDGVPKLLRLADHRLVAGVAAGVAVHLRARVGIVRAVFVILGLLAGAGVVAYALLWVFVPQAGQGSAVSVRSSERERRQALGIAAIGVAVGIVTIALGAGQWIGALLGPVVIVAIGAAFIWREADDAQRQRWRRTAAGLTTPRANGWWRIVAGIVLVVGGLAVFALAQVDVASVRSAVIAVALTLVGVAVIAIPWLAKLLRDLTDERRERIRETEKAEVAAHLHDSVLQTLALIQRQPNDPREVQRLARAQERDLRAWLYGPGGYARGLPPADAVAAPTAVPASCAAALTEAAAQVEDTYAVAVSPVIVGDLAVTDATGALVAAAREAMVNAAKHAGVAEISVYAEFEKPQATVFVRDRGRGFDQAGVPADRRGVSESIRGRMERYGGNAVVKSSPGGGTEWELTLGVTGPGDAAAD